MLLQEKSVAAGQSRPGFILISDVHAEAKLNQDPLIGYIYFSATVA